MKENSSKMPKKFNGSSILVRWLATDRSLLLTLAQYQTYKFLPLTLSTHNPDELKLAKLLSKAIAKILIKL